MNEPHNCFRSTVKVIKQRVVGTQACDSEEDLLVIEDPLEIELCFGKSTEGEKNESIITMRTPGHDKEMIYGFLYSEGIIQVAGDILSIDFNEPINCEAPTLAKVHLRKHLKNSVKKAERIFAIHSGCGVCGSTTVGKLKLPHSLRIEDATVVSADWIHNCPSVMMDRQSAFQQTGGLHAVAVFSKNGELIVSYEDVGRHNALDKAIGSNLINNLIPGYGQVLFVSGRMSYEIIQKALVARIPIVAGIGAPSSLAVTLANDFNLTLLGFVRDKSFNIYSCPERINYRR